MGMSLSRQFLAGRAGERVAVLHGSYQTVPLLRLPICWINLSYQLTTAPASCGRAKAMFISRSAKAVTGVIPDRVTTGGHDAYPRAIRTELGSRVWHRTICYLHNRLEQDPRGIKARCRPMLGFKSVASARRYCRGHDELRNFLRSRSHRIAPVREVQRRYAHYRDPGFLLWPLTGAETTDIG